MFAEKERKEDKEKHSKGIRPAVSPSVWKKHKCQLLFMAYTT